MSRWVRFSELHGYQFKLYFLVQQGSDEDDSAPLLGMLDTYENFDIYSRGETYYFLLADRHRGEAY